MACEVDVNGDCTPSLDNMETSGESEIPSMKQALKKAVQQDVSMNGVESVNGNSNGTNGGVENGHEDEISVESEVEPDTPRKRKYKQKQLRGKQLKPKKERKQRVSQRFLKNAEKEEEQASEVSWDGSEVQKKEEEENSIHDGAIDGGEDTAAVEEEKVQSDDIVMLKADPEEKQGYSTFHTFHRFGFRANKSQEPSTSTCTTNTSSTADSNERDTLLASLRSISGRRPLHEKSKDNVEDHCSLKRKAETDDDYAPESKLSKSFSERSPGWRFFSSPFNNFWSPKKATDATNPVSTQLRKLHEVVDDSNNTLENADESMDTSLEELKKEDICDEKQPSVTSETNTQSEEKSIFRCTIM